jgi:hypothetical protein
MAFPFQAAPCGTDGTFAVRDPMESEIRLAGTKVENQNRNNSDKTNPAHKKDGRAFHGRPP